MREDIFIGIDGGGTKTKARVEDSLGNILGQGVSGPANIRFSIEETWQSIYAAIQVALNSSGIHLQNNNEYQFHVGMGLAGCEVKDSYHAFLAKPHPFTTISLTSDAHTACLGAHYGNDGAIIAIGTGVVGYQIENDKGKKVSGWGFPYDDIGSGAWLGLEAVKLTFQWLDHRLEKNALVSEIFAFFNHNLDEFVKWSHHANASEFARLAPIVINHSQQEEVTAVRLIKKAAHAIDHIATAMIKMQNSPLPFCLTGGIAPFIEPWLGEELRSLLVPRQGDANIGAILMMRKGMKTCPI